MTYFEHIPSDPLSKYIDTFWYCKAENFTKSTLTIPFLHHELVINFSESYHIIQDIGSNSIIKNPTAWISGIQTKATISKCEGKHEMMGVLFKPNGLNAFMENDSSDFKNLLVDADLVFGNSFTYLLEKIQNTKVPKVKIQLLENYLINNLNHHDSPKYLDSSLKLFNLLTDHRISIKEACSQLMISNKSLIKTYHKAIGINPTKYLQLKLINRALFHLSNDPKQSFTELAYQLNFYDQAHFINVFKSITSMTPTEYSKHILRKNTDVATANYISMEG